MKGVTLTPICCRWRVHGRQGPDQAPAGAQRDGALWASVDEIERDETCYITQRWPQNWPQMRIFFDEQLSILERDEEEYADRASHYYNCRDRRSMVKKFYSVVKDIAKNTVGVNEVPVHNKHVQVFALISHFVYLIWTSAMVTHNHALLMEDPMGIWVRHFNTKMVAVQGKVDLPMKEAVVWLGYGCRGKCKKCGMCPGFCLYCDADIVTAKVRGVKGAGTDNSTYNSRYQAWKQEILNKNPSATNFSHAEFKKSTPKIKAGVKKAEGVQVGEEEYFAWLEENQDQFKLEIPPYFLK